MDFEARRNAVPDKYVCNSLMHPSIIKSLLESPSSFESVKQSSIIVDDRHRVSHVSLWKSRLWTFNEEYESCTGLLTGVKTAS